ncbi:MAG: AMP-binding protein [Candidatus Aureabacteria bacterium]|nr:AMP-binding protein [Candidatus Auribacterota bacterium]
MSETLTSKFSQIASESPEAVAVLTCDGNSVSSRTYGELYRSARKVACWLRSQGVRKGDRIALVMENRPEWSICYFGILLSGAIAVPIDVQSGPDELRDLLSRAMCRVLCTSEKISLEHIGDLQFLEAIVLTGAGPAAHEKAVTLSSIVSSDDKDIDLPSAVPHDSASIIFTSGTTGPSKGVVLTHQNLLSNYESLAQLNYVRPDDNFLSILPLHHAFPFMITLITPLFSRARITYVATLRVETILSCLKEQSVTLFAVTPQVLQLFHNAIVERLRRIPRALRWLLRSALRCGGSIERLTGVNPAAFLLRKLRAMIGKQFRHFVCGGARLDARIARDFLAWGFPVLEGYGLTETAPVATMNRPGKERPGSVGQAIHGVSIRILNPDERGVGEVLIKGDNVMQGYYQDEAATREALEDGWFHSGDLGRIDRKGFLFIEGRIKELIVLPSGKKVSAEEVEAHYAPLRSVKEICVFMDERGQKLVGAVVPDFEYFRKSGETNIRDYVKWDLEYAGERLPSYKRLKDFVIVNELPKTRLGKVKRQEVIGIYREELKSKTSGAHDARIEEPLSAIGETVRKILRRETGKENISPADHLELDLGIDSLGRVSIMSAIERECAVTLKEEGFLRALTVGDLISVVERTDQKGMPVEARVEESWGKILKSGPPAELRNRIDIKGGIFSRLLTVFAAVIFWPVLKIYFRFRVKGREHLPQSGFIICPNHTSYLDGFIVFCALPMSLKFRIFFLGLHNYFEVPVLRHMLRGLRIIPVDAARNIIETLQASYFVLENGKALCVFPEGARSISGDVQEFKKGVAILARESGARIIPAYIRGAHRAWRPGTWFPRPRSIRIRFGNPLSFDELKERGAGSPHADECEVAAHALRNAVIELAQ